MSRLEDDLLDVLLRHAAAEAGRREEEEADRLFAELDHPPAFEPSPRFCRQMRRLIRRTDFRAGGGPRRVLRRAAAFVLVCGVGMLTLTMSVDAMRARFFDFFFRDRGTHTEISFVENEAEEYLRESPQAAVFRYPAWLPNGYMLSESMVNEHSYTLIYLKEEESILINQSLIVPDMSYGVDTEDAECKEIEINGNEALYIEKDRHTSLILHDDTILTSISGSQIGRQEIVKIAENMEFINSPEK